MNTDDFTPTSLSELCKRRGVPITRQHISRLCRQGKMENAYRLTPKGGWIIPKETALRFIAEKKSPK